MIVDESRSRILKRPGNLKCKPVRRDAIQHNTLTRYSLPLQHEGRTEALNNVTEAHG